MYFEIGNPEAYSPPDLSNPLWQIIILVAGIGLFLKMAEGLEDSIRRRGVVRWVLVTVVYLSFIPLVYLSYLRFGGWAWLVGLVWMSVSFRFDDWIMKTKWPKKPST